MKFKKLAMGLTVLTLISSTAPTIQVFANGLESTVETNQNATLKTVSEDITEDMTVKSLTFDEYMYEGGYFFDKLSIKDCTSNGGGDTYVAYTNSQLDWVSDKENTEDFKVDLSTKFYKTQTVNRMIIHPANKNVGRTEKIAIYASKTDSGDDFELVGRTEITPDSQRKLVTFKPVEAKRMKVVFEKTKDNKGALSMIEFLEPNEDVKFHYDVMNLFKDSTMTKLKDENVSLNRINELRKKAQKYKDNELYLGVLNAAEAVVKNPGIYDKDIITVNQEAKERYARNEMKAKTSSGDYQITEIGAANGDYVEVFVDASGVKNRKYMPKLVVAKHGADAYSWEEVITLNDGYNRIQVGTYGNSWDRDGVSLYIYNPYKASEQSEAPNNQGQLTPNRGEAPKIRINGGVKYPVLRLNEGEAGKQAFYTELKNYLDTRAKNPKLPDIVELVADNVVFTVQASEAYKAYIEEGIDALDNLNYWQNSVVEGMEFFGIDNTTNKSKQENMVINYRLTKDANCLPADCFLKNMPIEQAEQVEYLRVVDGKFSSEKAERKASEDLGDFLELQTIEQADITSEMLREFYLKGYDSNAKFNYDEIYTNIVNEVGTNKNYKQLSKDNRVAMFWQLEILKPGYWAELQKSIREENPKFESKLDRDLSIVKHSSIIMGMDLTEHFQKYGYIPNDVVVPGIENLPKSEKKTWYLNNRYFEYNGEGLNSTHTATIENVDENGTITIKSDIPAEDLLGYEVLRDGKVLGFTIGNTFKDVHQYAVEAKEYKVIPYGRDLSVGETKEIVDEKPTEKPSEDENIAEDTYDTTKAYVKGDTVIYKGDKYTAKWWIQGEAPDTSQAWEKEAKLNEDGSQDWVEGIAYTQGNIVIYNGNKYEAKWWTTSTPGSDDSWKSIA